MYVHVITISITPAIPSTEESNNCIGSLLLFSSFLLLVCVLKSKIFFKFLKPKNRKIEKSKNRKIDDCCVKRYCRLCDIKKSTTRDHFFLLHISFLSVSLSLSVPPLHPTLSHSQKKLLRRGLRAIGCYVALLLLSHHSSLLVLHLHHVILLRCHRFTVCGFMGMR